MRSRPLASSAATARLLRQCIALKQGPVHYGAAVYSFSVEHFLGASVPRKFNLSSTILLLFVSSLAAAAPNVEAGRGGVRAAILLRAMAHERNLAAQQEPLRIAVVQGGPARDEMLEAFQGLATSVKVANRTLVPVAVPYTTPS